MRRQNYQDDAFFFAYAYKSHVEMETMTLHSKFSDFVNKCEKICCCVEKKFCFTNIYGDSVICFQNELCETIDCIFLIKVIS